MKKLKTFFIVVSTFYHTLCFSCITDVDIFNWKNVNLKGLRVVEFDPEHSQVLGITYHYNLQPNTWYSLRNSGITPQKTTLYAQSNGDIFIDQDFVGNVRTCGRITVGNQSENSTCNLSDYSASVEGKVKSRRFFSQATPSLYKIPAIYLFDAQNNIWTQENFSQIIPDTFDEKCLAKRHSIHSMQLRTLTASGSLGLEAKRMLESDRNNEKGALGELAMDLFILSKKYKCKLSIKDDDEHHGIYDSAHIPMDTDQPSTLVLTESKYKKGNIQQLINGFTKSYFSTFQKLWNSHRENAALKRRTAFIMRYAALQCNQSIYALINQGMPKVNIMEMKIDIDPVPFVSVLLTSPSITVQNSSSRTIIPGPSAENARKIVNLAYKGRNQNNSESLININIWFGFNEKTLTGKHKYILSKEIRSLTSNQLNIFERNFSYGIQKLLESNNLSELKKQKLIEIAGYSSLSLGIQYPQMQITQSDTLQSVIPQNQFVSITAEQLGSAETFPSYLTPLQNQFFLEPPNLSTSIPSLNLATTENLIPALQNQTNDAVQINTERQLYSTGFPQAYAQFRLVDQAEVQMISTFPPSHQQVLSHINPMTSQSMSTKPHGNMTINTNTAENFFTEILYQKLLKNLEIRFNYDYRKISVMAGYSGFNGKRDFQLMINSSYKNKMNRWNLLIRALQNESYIINDFLY